MYKIYVKWIYKVKVTFKIEPWKLNKKLKSHYKQFKVLDLKNETKNPVGVL